jgi:lysozyme family protein
MKDNFSYCLEHILKSEGGYVNHPRDPGGRTSLGITQRVWEEWTGKPSNEEEMRGLTVEDVRPIYRERYWNAVRGDDLPAGVDLSVFDFSVNSGVGRAARFLQRQVSVAEDGKIGPMTLRAVLAVNPESLIKTYCASRQAFLESLPTFPTFGRGWTVRVEKVRRDSVSLLLSHLSNGT